MLGKDYSISSYLFGGKINLDVRSYHKPNKYMWIKALNLFSFFQKKKSKHERAKLRVNIYQHPVGEGVSRFQKNERIHKGKDQWILLCKPV